MERGRDARRPHSNPRFREDRFFPRKRGNGLQTPARLRRAPPQTPVGFADTPFEKGARRGLSFFAASREKSFF